MMNSYKRRIEENVLGSSNSSELVLSNLNQFLEYTTPTVPVQFLPKTVLCDSIQRRWRSSETEPIPYFYLRDLWDSFDEWSAYGAGVPLVLNGEENVVQYYAPYLSALQLYVRSAARPHLNFRKLGEESDASDNEFRDTSSESSSDGESEMMWIQRSSIQRNRSSWHSECNLSHYVRPSDSAVDATNLRRSSSCSLVDDDHWEGNNINTSGELLFEYFEQAVPYSRVPLVDKIADLSHQSLEIRNLRSIDLLPTSWMSIAWYPIYRIPTGPTLQDLAACFLTYHSLSTPVEGGGSTIVKGDKVSLGSFGLASYKLRGTFWTSVGSSAERRLASDMQTCADVWLKEMNVRHPDFDFFVNNNNGVRRS